MHEEILSYNHPMLLKLLNVDTNRRHPGGFQAIFRFRNGYGASVIQHGFSYGSGEGKYELAVARWRGDDDDDWEICYSTDITGDVLGHLSSSHVRSILDQVGALPPDAQALAGAVLD